MQIHGSTILITGAASGLGAGCARWFCERGARVVLADIDQQGQQVAESLAGNSTSANSTSASSAAGGQARFCLTDVTDESSVEQTLDQAQRWFAPVQAVIHCAGVLGGARVVSREGPHDLDAFRRVIEVNLIGTFNVSRLAAARMIQLPAGEDGERGVIIQTSSVSAEEGQIGQAAYSASKGGVASMTLPMARELAKFGIRVVTIAPGVFETPMMEAAPEAISQSLAAQIPFPARFGKPSEFASLAQQILENRMLNGCTLRIDGAIRMQSK